MSTSPPGPNRWVAYCNPRPDARLRLFCFPYAGGGASVYRGWARHLPADVDVCPVQYPGRETRIQERPHTSLAAIVQEAANGLLPLLDRPYAFFGHSMGSLVAFELARHLVRAGHAAPAHVIVSGYRAPLLPYRTSLPHDLPTEEFTRRLRLLEGTPKEALDSPELMEFILPILRADCQVCDEYRYIDPTPLPCPLTAFGGMQDVEAQEESLRQWQSMTRAAFALRMFPGGHFFLQSAQADVLAALSSTLRAAA